MSQRQIHARARRVLLVSHHYAPESGAPQRRWSALASRLVPAGFEIGVLAPPPHYPSGTFTQREAHLLPGSVSTGEHGERIVRVAFREHTNKLSSRATDQLVAAVSSTRLGLRHFRRHAVRPGVVIATVPGIPSVFAGWFLARALRAAFVVEMRDAWPDLIEPSGILDRPGYRRRSLRRAARARITRLVHQAITRLQTRADLVVTTTSSFAHVLRERGVRQVAVIRNGTAFRPVRTPAPVVLEDRPLRVVYAGTVGRSQGLEVVVRAAALVKERGHSIDVRIVGHGHDLELLRRLAQNLGAPVTVGSSVPSTQVRDLYEWADTVVVSLRDWAPFEWTVPSKLYEVMASGVVVTACVAGEAADLVHDHGAGAVVRPGDVEGLADLWSAWIESGTVPAADPAAAAWVASETSDDQLASRYAVLLDDLLGHGVPVVEAAEATTPAPAAQPVTPGALAAQPLAANESAGS